MPSDRDPAEALSDIIENIERIASYVSGMDRHAFAKDGRTRDAVERCLERVCEAAHRLGDLAEQMMPNQSWRDIRGMGNRLRHGYDRIDIDVIWNAVRRDLPALEADVRRAFGSFSKDAKE